MHDNGPKLKYTKSSMVGEHPKNYRREQSVFASELPTSFTYTAEAPAMKCAIS
jgi:hypothetical protein